MKRSNQPVETVPHPGDGLVKVIELTIAHDEHGQLVRRLKPILGRPALFSQQTKSSPNSRCSSSNDSLISAWMRTARGMSLRHDK